MQIPTGPRLRHIVGRHRVVASEGAVLGGYRGPPHPLRADAGTGHGHAQLPTDWPCRDGGFVVGLRRHSCWRPDTAFVTLACPARPPPTISTGVVGPDALLGRHDAGQHRGRWLAPRNAADSGRSTDHGRRAWRSCRADFGITNTMVWTRDGGHHRRYARNASIATPGWKRRAPSFSDLAAGHLTAQPPTAPARYSTRVAGGSAIAQLTPQGSLVRLIGLPCSAPTSCTFGGADLKTLFVTSSRFGMSSAHLRANPQEGGLFAVTMETPGQLPNLFAH